MQVGHFKNRILSRLPLDALELLQPHLEHVPLRHRQVVETRHRPIAHLYFVERGFISVVAGGRMPEVEVGLIGCEGVTGLPVVLGVRNSPFDANVQSAGDAYRIEASVLIGIVQNCDVLRAAILRFVYVFFVQVANTSAASSRGTIDQRLARWLLMAHDRLDSDTIKLTHELLSIMLGVQRPGITLALASLQDKGLVVAARGKITLVDRSGLERLAGALYGLAEAEMKRLT